MKDNSKSLIILGVAVLILLVFIFLAPYHPLPSSPDISGNQPQACTDEAKICPDRSAVGRTGPNCEFAACPAVVVPDSWKTFSDLTTGVTFKYPPTLSTTYIGLTDWPPKVQVLDSPVPCIEAGATADRTGQTQTKIINNHTYCVTEVTGAAAGSIYHQYAYGTISGSREAILTFTLQYPQCLNYNGPQQSACQNEESSLNVDNIIDQIVSTLSIQ